MSHSFQNHGFWNYTSATLICQEGLEGQLGPQGWPTLTEARWAMPSHQCLSGFRGWPPLRLAPVSLRVLRGREDIYTGCTVAPMPLCPGYLPPGDILEKHRHRTPSSVRQDTHHNAMCNRQEEGTIQRPIQSRVSQQHPHSRITALWVRWSPGSPMRWCQRHITEWKGSFSRH